MVVMSQVLTYAQSFLLNEFVDSFYWHLPLALRTSPPSRAMLSRVLNSLDERRIERYQAFQNEPSSLYDQISIVAYVAKPLTVALLLRCGITEPTILDHCMQVFDVDDESEIQLD